ncbi:hypothetical protein PA598K_02696 [Paenibacillus sp. 598K]|uniref:M24 family metallopeptidase n=1 Tax=Paenibacillus sp. 598K TaxID=1117987 RepID=UPI000FFA4252|nr:M24 family metallopeptidase [Paenibacillus sp. 598K]GBF74357.1 hypothetical protein PA598K_02696 [Paenibacillus sp. 598K]
MNVMWRELLLPDFGIPEEAPVIPIDILEARCRRAYGAAGCDWFAVYGDREHFANLHYLTGFDPRFEEALLLMGPDGRKYLLVGNECIEYAVTVRIEISLVLCQPFSLPGQDRTRSPKLSDILREVGLTRGQTVGICGWKYTAHPELREHEALHAPAILIHSVASAIGGTDGIKDVTQVLMDASDGLRAYSEVDQIAVNEWAAARASSALHRVVKGTRPGASEMQAVSSMQYAGEPLSVHIMYASGQDDIVGLRSPSSRKVEAGDAVFSAIGYWGGLSARGGLVDTDNSSFLDKWAIPYYRGIAAWYGAASIGVTGGDIYAIVSEELARGGMKPALNPGHLIGADEWVNSFFAPGNPTKIASGMAVQCDIIPTPMAKGIVLNCEDSVVFADEALREQLKSKYPAVWSRIQARQQFVRNEIGIALSDDLLPLSNTPAYYAPLFLSPGHALALG